MNQPETKNQEKSPTSTLSLDLIELSTVLIIPNFIPHTINLDFLKYNEIIPDDWAIADHPIINNFQVKFSFVNKVKINAENNRIILSEVLEKQDKPKIPSITCELIQKLNQFDYLALGFNTNHLVIFNPNQDIARRYITEKWLRPGAWYKASKAPIKASINYFYTLEECKLDLNITEATFQIPKQPVQPAILFTSNFHYDLQGETSLDRQKHLLQTLENWELIIKKNQKIIYAFFN
ncbi:MAG: hypothetical protein EAZ76_02005 [Nostocales cyanobacterium]|nr:MAG: hypothetical protein EAZ87_13420 [Nostocales cyanobacterium]TAF20270.1 MAG: hypothetical protein EAZ76_02005 [Nostocales cyanobacterium]